jgi:hypothetical protein
MPLNPQTIRRAALSIYASIVAISVIIVLAFGPALVARQYGYTWSLLIWLAPNLAILYWFLSSSEYEISRKKALGWAVIYLFLNGVILDVFCAHYFFTFPNRRAVLGIYLPGFSLSEFRLVWEKPFPIEEMFFYFFGFVCILLIYVWSDEYWLARYQLPDRDAGRRSAGPLLGLHAKSLLLALALLIFATVVKAIANPASGCVLPWYMALQIVMAFAPIVTLIKTTEKFVNWRAFSFTLVATLLISIIYEVTLGVPGEWWGYQKAPMVGLFIASWHGLPIEAVTLWFAAVFMTVLVFEALKTHFAKKKC